MHIRDGMPNNRQVSKIIGRHNDHDKQPDQIVVADELSTPSEKYQAKGII